MTVSSDTPPVPDQPEPGTSPVPEASDTPAVPPAQPGASPVPGAQPGTPPVPKRPAPSYYREYPPQPRTPKSPDLLTRLRGPDGRIPQRTRWLLAGGGLLAAVLLVLGGGFFKLLAVLGAAILVIGAMAFYGVRVPRLRTRGAGAITCVVGFAVLFVAALLGR